MFLQLCTAESETLHRRHGYLMGLQERNERLFFKVGSQGLFWVLLDWWQRSGKVSGVMLLIPF